MKIVPLGFLSVGLVILMQVISPVISYGIWEIGQNFNNRDLVSPLKSSGEVLGISVQNKDNFSSFVSSWERESKPAYREFTITVPRLTIKSQIVEVDSNDLSQSLAHLPGSALPGEKGNVFISGHSAVNRFFVGKNAPFARLTDLKKGDNIEVLAEGTKFVYQVISFKVVDPSDLSVILAPDKMGRYISLMTCVPPGLNLKRLVVLGKML